MIKLLESLMAQSNPKTLIFVETKRKADDLTRWMRRDGWPALCIHGDKAQSEREWVLNEFKTGKTPILIATDVAARGLDVDDIKVVINYDFPQCSEDYVHRIGRTGRVDRKGTAYTFFTLGNCKSAEDLIKVMEEAKQQVPPELYRLKEMGKSYRAGRIRSRWRGRDEDSGSRGRDRGGNKRSAGGGGGPAAKRGRGGGGGFSNGGSYW